MDDLGTNVELFRAVGYWDRVCTSFLVRELRVGRKL